MKRKATIPVLILILVLLLAVSAAHSQDTPIQLTVGFYGAETHPAAQGMLVAASEIQGIDPVEGPDGQTYQIVGKVSADINELQDAIMILVAPESPTPVDPVTLPMPIVYLSSDQPLILENIEGAIFRGLTSNDQLYRMLGDYAVRFSQAQRVTLIGDPQIYAEFYTVYSEFLQGLDQTGNLTIKTVAADLPELSDITSIAEDDPQIVVYRGSMENAGAIVAALELEGWSGVFVYHQAFEAAQAGVIIPPDGIQVVGMTTWTSSFEDDLSTSFTENYLALAGDPPNDTAVVAYDATWAIRLMVRRVGADPATLTESLPNTEIIRTTVGTINVGGFGGTDLYRSGAIYELTELGGTNILARYDEGALQVDEPEVPETEPTPLPSPTPSQPVVTATSNVNVRSGPGANYERVGSLQEGVTVGVLGAIPDYSWYLIQASNGTGWVNAAFVVLFNPAGGVNGIPIVPIPPTPAPTLTPQVVFTATPSGQPDLIIDNVILTPDRVVVGQPFQASVAIRNAGTVASGPFQVSATWNPGNVATSVSIPALNPFGTVDAILQATLVQTGAATVQVMVDAPNAVFEGNESNNVFSISYVVDAKETIAATNTFGTGQLNFAGNMPDINWTGASLDSLNGATLGVISGIEFDDVHVGLLSASAIVNASVGTIAPGTVFGMRTGQGHCGVFRIENQVGANISLSWRMYAIEDCD